MANEKISELPSGNPAQANDAVPIARGGTNYSLAASAIAALAPPNIGFQVSGNTLGATSLISSGTLYLAGGNNVTLSQNGQSVTISGAATVPTFSAGVSGGNTAGTTGVTGSQIVFAGGNNVTLSQSNDTNGASITISAFNQTVQTQASGNIARTGFATTSSAGSVIAGTNNTAGFTLGVPPFITTQTAQTQNVVDVTLGGNTSGTLALISSGTLFLAGGNNVTLSQVGQSVTISANTVAAATLSVSAGTTSGSFAGVTFSNSNNISFGLNNGTITATAVSQTVQTQASGNIAGTGFATTTTNGSVVVGTLNTAGQTLAVPPYITTQTVQTQNVMDMTLGGNTSGTLALISSGTLFLAGGNNVTLSQVGQSVTISANTVAAANLSVSAGTTSGAFGGVTFADSNNISWGLNNGTITATISQSTQTQASGNIAGTGFVTTTTNGSVIVGTLNTIGMTLAVPSYITSTQTVQTQNLHDVTLGGNTTGTLALISSGTLFLAGGNNITLSQVGQSISISGAGSGSNFAAGISNLGNTVGNSGVTGTQLVLAGGNNVTLSQVTGANGATLTVSAAAQTNQSIGVYASSQTVGQSSSSTIDARSFTYVGKGIVSVGLSGASLLISGNQSNQTLGLYASSNTIAQSSSSTVDARSLSLVGAGFISVGLSQGSYIISGPGTTGISQSMYATGNTTQSSSGTASIGSLLVQGAGNVSVGVSNGSLVISGAGGGGGGGGVNLGVSTFGNTAGSTGTISTGNVILVGSGPISLSQSTGAAGSAATITINAPATSSISGTGLVSISVNASTISIGAAVPQLSFFQPLGPVQTTVITQNGAGSVQVYPAVAAFPFSASRADIMVSMSLSNLALSTEAQTLSMYVGLYSLNGSTLSLASSGSQSYAWTNSSNGSSASLSGLRRFSAPINVNYTGGFDLFVGLMSNTAFANTDGISMSNVVVPLGPSPTLQGLIGQTQVTSMQFVPGQGLFSATSAALPGSIALSQIKGAGSGGAAVDYYAPVQFANLTA